MAPVKTIPTSFTHLKETDGVCSSYADTLLGNPKRKV
jgi:hypothetical protein